MTRPAAVRWAEVPLARSQAYVITYRLGEPNPCPACAGRMWMVGRVVAECAFCGTALPIAGEGRRQ